MTTGVLTISVNKKQLSGIAAKLSKLSPKDGGKALYSGFVAATLTLEARLKENISGSFLKVRTGRLRASIGSIVTDSNTTNQGLQARIGSGVRQGERMPYADILETGGIITPKKGRFLTIPTEYAKTSSGVARFTAAQVRDGQTKYIASFIDKGIIFGVISRGKKNIKSRIEPLFVLKTSVTIPAKYWMSRTVDQNTDIVVDTILKKISEVMNS